MKRRLVTPISAAILTLLVMVAVPGEAEPTGFVSLTFDDGQASQSSVGLRGLPATFYVNSAKIGSSSYYMTWEQVVARRAQGSEIGGHTLTHRRLSSLSDEAVRREVCDDRASIQAHLGDGVPAPVSFAYPYGDYDADVQRIVRECGYTSGRGVAAVRTTEAIPPRDPYALRIFKAVTTSTTLKDLQAAVVRAESSGGWAIIVFHGVCDDRCAGTYSINRATFNQFIEWLSQRSTVVVRPVGEVMALSGI